MKRSKAVAVSLTTLTLALTGCGSGKRPPSNPDIIRPAQLPDSQREKLPAYTPTTDPSAAKPPLNAYDEHLGYYHAEVSQWYPYPYDYYDHRWGYYRNGKWSRYNADRSYYHSSNGLRSTHGHGSGLMGGLVGAGIAAAGAATANGPQNFSNGPQSTGVSGSFGSPLPGSNATPPPMPGRATPPPMPDYDTQPAAAPRHSGTSQASATSVRSSSVNRGGFGSTGKSSSSFFGGGSSSSS